MLHTIPASFVRRALAILATAAITSQAFAVTNNVSTLAALQTAINGAHAGDVIILANGSYSGSTITINRVGTSNAPILIQAQTIGGVNLTAGGFQFDSPAAWVTVQGFNITGAAGVNVINWLTSHCRFSHNYFQCSGNNFYVQLAGDDAQFDYNELRNKTTTGQMIRIDGNVINNALTNNPIAQRVWIHHNYFHDFVGTGANGGETIRYGLGVYAASSGLGLVEYNLFDKCNGDSAEMISSKVANNTYRFNTILNTLTNSFKIRESTGSLVYGNYFSNSLGLVVWSYYHKVYANYFVNCTGGIQIGPGDTTTLDYGNASHVCPRYNVLAFNTFVNNTYNIYQSGGDIYGAQSNTIANNLIVGGAKACDWYTQSSPQAFFTNGVFTNNILYNTTAGDMPASGYISSAVNPLLNVTDAYGVPHLAAASPAIGAAAPGYTNVLVDFDGQPRPLTGADVGADQYSTLPITAHRLSTNDVGPLYTTAAPPTFNPPAGTYASATNVAIGTTSVGAIIGYTTDGSTPSKTNGTIYLGVPVTVSSSVTLKAIAYYSGLTDSTVSSAAYTIGQGQIAATVTLGNLSQTYDGIAKSVTYTTSPSNLTVILTYNGSSLAPTNAGSYIVIGTISDPVYYGSATNTLVINKATATATLAVGNSPQTYTGAGQSATVSITSSNTPGSVANTLTGGAATQVSSSSYAVTADFVPANTNYSTLTGLSAGNFVISKVTPVLTLTASAITYGQTLASSSLSSSVATNTANHTQVSGGFVFADTSIAPNAGLTNVIANFIPTDTTNYNSASGTVNVTVNKANSSVTLNGGTNFTYDGSAKTAAFTFSGSAGAQTYSYNGTGYGPTPNAPTNSGNYSVAAMLAADANYYGATNIQLFTVNKAAATVTLTNLSQTYDGAAKSVVAATVPPDLTVVLTYNNSPNAPTNVGSYNVAGTISDSNYTGSTNGTLFIMAPPRFSNVAFSVASGFSFSGTGPTGQVYRIFATTNMLLPFSNWTAISTGSFGGGIFSFTDLQTSNQPQRFYRVISP